MFFLQYSEYYSQRCCLSREAPDDIGAPSHLFECPLQSISAADILPMVLRETVEGETFAQVFSQYLDGSGKLSAIASQEVVGFCLGIIQAGGVEDTMQYSLYLSLPLLRHPGQHIPHAVHYAALSWQLWPGITNSPQKARVAIGDDELRRFESPALQIM